MSGSAVDAGRLLIQVEASTENLKRQLDQAVQAVAAAASGMQGSIDKTNHAFESVGEAVNVAVKGIQSFISAMSPATGSMIGMVAAGTGIERMFEKIGEKAGEYVKEIIKIGDEHDKFIAQLTALTGSAEQAEASFAALEQMTAKTGITASGAVDMYKRLTVAAQETGLTNTQVLQMIKTVEDAGVVSGASLDQMRSVVDRIALSLTTGTVNARLFRTMVSEMPELAKDIADGLHMSVSEMMDLVKHGKLATDQLAVGMLAATEKVDAKLAGMPVSLSRAWGELGGAMDQLIVGINTAIGLTSKLSWLVQSAAAGVRNLLGNLRLGDEIANVNTEVQRAADEVKGLEKVIANLKAPTFSSFGAAATQAIAGSHLAEQQKYLDEANVRLQAALEAQKAIQDKANGALAEGDQERHDKAIELAKDREQKITDTVIEHNDKRTKLMNEYNKDMADIKRQMSIDPAAGGLEFATGMALMKTRTDEFNEALKKLNETHEKHDKAAENAAKKMQEVVDATGRARDAAVALMLVHKQGKAAIEEVNTQNAINNELTKAGIPLNTTLVGVMKDKAAEIEANVRGEQGAKVATKEWDDATKAKTESDKKASDQLKEYARQLEQTTKEIGTGIAEALYGALTNEKKGQSFIDYFKGLFKKLAVEALNADIIMPIIRPIVSAGASILGVGTVGGGQQIFNAAGEVIGTVGGGTGGAGGVVGAAATSGGGSGIFGNAASAGGLLAKIPGLTDSLGLTGEGGLFGSGGFLGGGGAVSTFLSSPISFSGIGTAPLAGLGPSSVGSSTLASAGAGATVGGALSGVGAGFGAGMLINSLVGGNQLGGTVGSGVGAIAGTAAGIALTPILGPFGPLIGGLIGGAAGGGFGGMFGPGPKHQAFGINTKVQDNQIQVIRAIGSDQAGLKAALDDANAQIGQLNQIVSAAGLTVTTAGDYGTIGKGNAAKQAATFAETIPTDYRFAGPAGSDLATALANSGGVVQSAKALTDLVTFVTGEYAQLSKTAEKTNQYDDAVTSLTTTYADAISKAQSYGLATDKLSQNLADGVAKINEAHQQAINALQGGANVALLQAQGRTYEANVYGMGSGKQKQLDDLRDQLEALGLTAADAAPWVDKLSQAIDLNIQKIIDANAAQITSTLQASQIEAMNARGLTYQAAQLKMSIDQQAAIKNLTDTLTALGVTADAAKPYIDDLTAAYQEQAIAAANDNAEAIRQKTASLQLEVMNAEAALDPAKKAAADMATLIEKQYEDQLALQDFMKSHNATIDEMTKAYGLLGDAQQKERDALAATTATTNAATDALLSSGKSIQQYLDSLNQTGAGGLSPTDQYAAAKQIFGDQLALAGSGNTDALANITSNATAFLDAAKAMYGSGQGYQDAVSLVKKDLTGLPATTSYEAQVLAALKDLGGGINVQVELDVIRTIKETLNALSEADKNKLQVSEDIVHTIEETLGRAITGAEFDHIMALNGLSPEVIQIIDQSMQGMTPDQYIQAFKLSELDPAVLQQVTQTLQTVGTLVPTDDVTKTIVQDLKDAGATEITADDLIKKITQLLNNTGSDPISSDQIVKDIEQSISNIGVALVSGEALTKEISQKLSNIGDEVITSDSLYKSIVQDVTTTEALTVHISDTLDGIFNEIKLVLDAINTNTYNTVLNTAGIGNSGGEGAGREASAAPGPSVDLSQAGPGDAGGAGYALGGVFSRGRVIPFAAGGIFNQPTYAPMALFGEAGPEAIMPLRRDASGRLGVSVGRADDGSHSSDSTSDVSAAFAQVAIVLRDEIRAMRGDIQDVRAVLRRAVAG